MRKGFLMLTALALVFGVSCEKENGGSSKDAGITSAVLHLEMDYEFDIDSEKIPQGLTSFECLDVEARYDVGGKEGSDAVDSKTWSRDVEITSFPCEFSFTSAFALKSEYEGEDKLPESLSANFTAPHEGKISLLGINSFHLEVDFYSGDKLVGTERVPLEAVGGINVATGFRAREVGLEKTQKHLSNRSLYGFKGSVKLPKTQQ